MLNAVGIDVSKAAVRCVLQPGGMVHKPFDVSTHHRAHQLTTYLGSLEGDTRVVMEAPGVSEPILKALTKQVCLSAQSIHI